MRSIDEATWEKLTKPIGNKLIARLALSDLSSQLFCALDIKGNRHFLILLNNDDYDFNDSQSRGISVTTSNLLVQGQEPQRFLDLECLDNSGYSIFNMIGGEIARDLARKDKKTNKIVDDVLIKWRRFWGQMPKQLLPREEQIGLFAEIFFMANWLLPEIGSNGIMAWRGPWGSRHDFEWSDKSVEVKATTNKRGRIHQIHGISQLENPKNGVLYLFSVSLHEEASSVENLPSLIEKCRNHLKNSEEALLYFDDTLAHSGYSPIFEDDYSKLKFQISENILFKVVDDFPRLTHELFSDQLPSGIEKIYYEINLNTFDHLIVSYRPDELPFK